MSAPDSFPPRSSLAPAQPAAAAADAFHSSGQSPGRPTLHLVGPGRVGQSLLHQLALLPPHATFVLVAVSDATATAYARDGLDPRAIAAHKAGGRPLAEWPNAERLATDTAIGVVAADCVVDATPTGARGTVAAVERGRAALRSGAFLALCGKDALAAAAGEWLAPTLRRRLGIDAALGGAGRQLLGELDDLRARCTGLALVGNVTTTVVVQCIERGGSLADGLAAATARGLLEPDAVQDLDGSDAATKLAAVAGALFGASWRRALDPQTVPRDDLRELDVALVRERARRGATTRLVARTGPEGHDPRVRYEELPLGSPLACPADRVVYGYEVAGGLRLHTGLALGHERTAAAALGDLVAAFATATVACGGEVRS